MLETRSVVVGLYSTNCWIIGSRRHAAACVVDPGDEPDKILALARDIDVTITQVVATHAHLDHLMAARTVTQATNSPFLLHEADVPMAGDARLAAELWPELVATRGEFYPQVPDRLLQKGDGIEIAGMHVRVLHTPGHTPGSICLYAPEVGLLFSGDTLLRGSVGRADQPGADYTLMLRNIKQQLMTLPDDTRVLTGHGEATTIGQERATNPFVLQALHAPLPAAAWRRIARYTLSRRFRVLRSMRRRLGRIHSPG